MSRARLSLSPLSIAICFLADDDGIVVVEVGKGHEMDAAVVPVALGEHLGPEATDGLITLFNLAEQECVDTVVTRSVDRFERRLTEEVGKLRVEMLQGDAALRQEMAQLRLELRQEMTGLRGDLRQELASQKSDLLKWSFLFWIGQIATIAGVVSVLLRASGR